MTGRAISQQSYRLGIGENSSHRLQADIWAMMHLIRNKKNTSQLDETIFAGLGKPG